MTRRAHRRASILGNLQGLVTAREAQAGILNDSEPLRKGLETLQDQPRQGNRHPHEPLGA